MSGSLAALLPKITNLVRITDHLEHFSVKEQCVGRRLPRCSAYSPRRPLSFLSDLHPNVRVVHAAVATVDPARRVVVTTGTPHWPPLPHIRASWGCWW